VDTGKLGKFYGRSCKNSNYAHFKQFILISRLLRLG
jgi:hypothetical protein